MLATANATLLAAAVAIVCAFVGAGFASIPWEFGYGALIYGPALTSAVCVAICALWFSRTSKARRF